jgi:asparagine synthase (glutamine-hydrolysing)
MNEPFTSRQEMQRDATNHAALAATREIFAGTPRFTDPAIAAVAARDGVAAAWREAYRRHGDHAAEYAVGDFAIALVTPDGGHYLAVDRFAVRTLCYRVVDGTLHAAERADELADAATDIDPQAIFNYLFFHVIPSPRTIYADIFRLPPGHRARFANGKLDVAPYWIARFDEIRAPDFPALRDTFRQCIREAVKEQIGARPPEAVACFLSGGTDSSTVAGMAGEVLGQPAATYSIGFDAEGYDEMEYARIAVRHFKTRHHEYYITPDDLLRSIPEVAGSYDQPFGNSSALPTYYCARIAQADGVGKMLAGDGGDELFGGNARYVKQRVFDWYGLLPGVLRGALLEPIFARPAMVRLPLVRKGASYVEQARVPMPDRLNMYNLLLRLGIDDVLTKDFLARVDIETPAREQREAWALADTHHLINRTLAFDWRYTLAENDLPKVCGTTRLAGVEVGFPLLDQRLLDFSLKLPADYKLKGLRLRWFFKEALRGFLPDEILVKKKHGFGLPFGIWATRHAGLKRLAEDSLHALSGRGIVRPEFIRTLLAERLQEYPGYYGEMVWILMMLEQWLQQHAPDYKV